MVTFSSCILILPVVLSESSTSALKVDSEVEVIPLDSTMWELISRAVSSCADDWKASMLNATRPIFWGKEVVHSDLSLNQSTYIPIPGGLRNDLPISRRCVCNISSLDTTFDEPGLNKQSTRLVTMDARHCSDSPVPCSLSLL